MHILVCGGAGYIGSHMCKMLAEHGHRVTVLDNLSTGHADAVKWGTLVEADLLKPAGLDALFAQGKFDAVMHFCAKSLVGESMTRPELYYSNNVAGTLNLLESMLRHNVRHLVFSSTAAVFGMPLYTPIDEQHPTAPINPYGKSKLMVEQLLADYDRAFGLRSVSLRYFNAAGADPSGIIGERHEPETHLIPNILRSLRGNAAAALQVFGYDYETPDGTCLRDYIHVNDLSLAHLKALDYLSAGGATASFNLGNGQGFSVLDVIRAAEEVTGEKVAYQIAPRRAGDPPVLVASAKKANEILSWTPAYADIKQIIQSAWNWHRAAN